ncbi:MAG TPA: TVP38/TMEM64 family protein [Geminicoccaceae bacterium]|nr:TVP38/TMEM64 family protein [Geminicoccaceae bacterium]
MSEARTAPARRAGRLRRFLPLLILLLLVAAVFALGLDDYLSFEALAEHRAALLAFVAERPVLAPVLFCLAYMAAVALSIPGAVWLTLASGFLFGTLVGGLIAVIAATLGAIAVFLIARTAVGDLLKRKAGPWLARMERGFRENALSYLLLLRLVPIFPFWLVNIAPAFLGVPLGTYALATFVGIAPATMVYAGIGSGLGAVFEQGGRPDLGVILRPELILPLVGLGLLALLPIVYKRWKARPGR